MSSSLRDQLLKAGLVNEKQLRKNRKGKPGKSARKGAKSPEQQQREAELKALAEHKKARDRELNQQRNRQREAQEQAEWVRQLIRAHAQDKQPATEDDKAFNFTIDGKVHHLYVAAGQREQLARGRLGIVWFDGQYQLLPADQAGRIHERLGRRVWLATLVEAASEPKGEDDDFYAQFEVPDDLMW